MQHLCPTRLALKSCRNLSLIFLCSGPARDHQVRRGNEAELKMKKWRRIIIIIVSSQYIIAISHPIKNYVEQHQQESKTERLSEIKAVGQAKTNQAPPLQNEEMGMSDQEILSFSYAMGMTVTVTV